MPLKYKKLLTALIFMLCSWHGFAQKIGTFQHIYAVSSAVQYASSVVALPDKGFMTAGISYSNINNVTVCKILIIRMDSLGRQLWSKTYAGTGTGNNSSGIVGQNYLYTGVDMVLSPEGNVVVCSNTLDVQAVYLFKINLNGNVLWSKTFPGGNKTASTLGLYVINAPGGGYVLTGASTVISSHGEALVIKTDTAGNIIWSHIYYHGGSQGAGIQIAPSRDGGYLIGGVSADTTISAELTYPGDYLVIKIDKNGKLLWSKILSNQNSATSTNFEAANSILELPDKSIYICGSGWGHIGSIGVQVGALIKMDSIGNVLWSKTYVKGNNNNVFFNSAL